MALFGDQGAVQEKVHDLLGRQRLLFVRGPGAESGHAEEDLREGFSGKAQALLVRLQQFRDGSPNLGQAAEDPEVIAAE